MKIRGSLAVMAGVAVALAGVGVASAQFVSLDGAAMHVAAQHVDADQKVTKSFDQVPAKDVVAWARSRNLPLTIADSDIPDRLVTLKLEDVEPINVGPLLAEAMGLCAKKDGDHYSLGKIDGPDVVIEADGDSLPAIISANDIGDLAQIADMPEIEGLPHLVIDGAVLPATAMVGEIPQIFEKIKKEMGLKDLKDIEKADEKTKQRFKELVEKHMGEWSKKFEAKFDSKAFNLKMEKFGKEMEQKYNSPEYKAKMEAWAKKFDSPEFKAKMEKFGKDMELKFNSKEFQGKMEGFAKEMKAHAGEFKMSDEQMKKLHEHMSKLHEELGHLKSMDGFKGFDPKALAELKALRLTPGQDGKIVIVGPDGKKQTMDLKAGEGKGYTIVSPGKDGKFTVVGPDGKKQTVELKSTDGKGHTFVLGEGGQFKAFAGDMKEFNGKAPKFLHTGDNIKQLLKSMTSEQEKLMKTQGYLTPSDLSPAQRELLGSIGTGDFEMSFSVDGKTIRIKSKEQKPVNKVGV